MKNRDHARSNSILPISCFFRLFFFFSFGKSGESRAIVGEEGRPGLHLFKFTIPRYGSSEGERVRAKIRVLYVPARVTRRSVPSSRYRVIGADRAAVIGLCPTENVRRTLNLRVRGIRVEAKWRSFTRRRVTSFSETNPDLTDLFLSFFPSFKNVGTLEKRRKKERNFRFLERSEKKEILIAFYD